MGDNGWNSCVNKINSCIVSGLDGIRVFLSLQIGPFSFGWWKLLSETMPANRLITVPLFHFF